MDDVQQDIEIPETEVLQNIEIPQTLDEEGAKVLSVEIITEEELQNMIGDWSGNVIKTGEDDIAVLLKSWDQIELLEHLKSK